MRSMAEVMVAEPRLLPPPSPAATWLDLKQEWSGLPWDPDEEYEGDDREQLHRMLYDDAVQRLGAHRAVPQARASAPDGGAAGGVSGSRTLTVNQTNDDSAATMKSCDGIVAWLNRYKDAIADARADARAVILTALLGPADAMRRVVRAWDVAHRVQSVQTERDILDLLIFATGS